MWYAAKHRSPMTPPFLDVDYTWQITTSSGLVLLCSFWCHSSIIPPLQSLFLCQIKNILCIQLIKYIFKKIQPLSWSNNPPGRAPEWLVFHLGCAALHLLLHRGPQWTWSSAVALHTGGGPCTCLEESLWACPGLCWSHWNWKKKKKKSSSHEERVQDQPTHLANKEEIDLICLIMCSIYPKKEISMWCTFTGMHKHAHASR